MVNSGALVAASIFFLTQFGICVWWASKTTQILKDIEKDIKEVRKQLTINDSRLAALERRMEVVEVRCRNFHFNGESKDERTRKTS